MVDRIVRYQNYINEIDSDKKMNPFLYNIMVVNWQGSGKDLLLNAEILNHYIFKKSLFDQVWCYLLFRPNYLKHVENVYSNCKLNRDVYGDDYYKIDTLKDISEATDGILYLNEMEKYFNSRGQDITKPSPELIDLINNSRKNMLIMEGSCHRYMSIDVKIRELFQLFVVPDIYIKPGCSGEYMRDYTIVCKLYDSFGSKLIPFVLDDLFKYGDLFDTSEKAVALKNSL